MSQPAGDAPVAPTPEAFLDSVTKLTATVEAQNQKIADLQSRADQAAAEARKSPFGAPFARTGESALTSRGYSYLKAFGLIAGQIDEANAKVEADLARKMKEYHSGLAGYKPAQPKSVMLPLGAEFIVNDAGLAAEARDVVKAGTTAFTPDDVAEVRRKMYEAGARKALSWLDDSSVGTLVGPPVMGELIELLRNNEVFLAAGCRVIPMPPTGRITWPRHTSGMTGYHVGEGVAITESAPGTDDLTLTAKKLTVLGKVNNELFHFASIAIEQFLRMDMAKTLSLKMDKTLLEDAGSQTTPKGLINYAIQSHTSTDPGTTTDGYRFQPKDVWQMIAKVEERNAQFNAFVMRPLLYASLVNKRADAITAGDGQGQFLFNIVRDAGTDMSPERLKKGNLSGYPVLKTTQVRTTSAKGSATDLTYAVGGDFTDYVLAMSPAIEYAVTNSGDTPFVNDQTWFKGVTYYDGAPRHLESFVWCEDLIQSF
jgi:HK97 family phage major capsid protein